MKYLETLVFNLLIIGVEIIGLISLIAVFSHWWSPLTSVVSVIVCGTIVGVLLSVKKKRRMFRKPSLSSTTWVVFGILVLSTIAGIPPLASVRNNVVNVAKDMFQSPPPVIAPLDKSIVGKWQEVVDNKVSIMSPTIQFLRNGTVIIDDGRNVLVGTYNKLTDEYVRIDIETSFFGVPITSMDTIKYQISSNRLTIRVGGRVSTYQRVVE